MRTAESVASRSLESRWVEGKGLLFLDIENKIILVNLSEGAMGGGREKENVRE
jgi:hypothetical protein